MRQSSIIDIISPVMAGPSSSHTAGAVRLGLLARNIYNECPRKVTSGFIIPMQKQEKVMVLIKDYWQGF